MYVPFRYLDHIAVKRTRRGSFLAVHASSDQQLQQDDCNSFLFKSRLTIAADNAAVQAARRLLDEHKVNGFDVSLENCYRDKGWWVFPLDRM